MTFRILHARQEGCAEPEYRITAVAETQNTSALAGTLTWTFSLDAENQVRSSQTYFSLSSAPFTEISGARTFRDPIGANVPALSLEIADRDDWHVSGRLWGELQEVDAATPISLSVDATFDIDTGYFTSLPD